MILAILGVLGYYGWKVLMSDDAQPSCAATNSACVAKCRKTATEAPAMQACQDDCKRDLAACGSK